MEPKNILLTGQPGCGKTTVIRRLIDRLGDLRVAGFYTLELREHGQGVGFEAVSLSGQRAILAHVNFRSKHRVSKYGVEPERLAKLLQAELQRPADAWNCSARHSSRRCRDCLTARCPSSPPSP